MRLYIRDNVTFFLCVEYNWDFQISLCFIRHFFSDVEKDDRFLRYFIEGMTLNHSSSKLFFFYFLQSVVAAR